MFITVNKYGKYSNGSGLVIVLVVLAVLGGIGFYAYSKGYINRNLMTGSRDDTGYTLTPVSGENKNTIENNSGGEAGSSDVLATSNSISLSVLSPLDGASVNGSNKLTVRGRTSANAEVFVNDASTKADADGNFSLEILLDEGVNTVTITANDEEGNVAEQTVSVTYWSF